MNTDTREYRMKVAKRIKAERDLTGLTQKEFASTVGLSNQTYNNLENGLGSLKIEHLHKISEKCGCDMGYLLGDYDNRTREETDICKATGLSAESVRILKNLEHIDLLNTDIRVNIANNILSGYDYSKRRTYMFYKTLNMIIRAFKVHATYSDYKEGVFPINRITDYLAEKQVLSVLLQDELFQTVIEHIDDLEKKYEEETYKAEKIAEAYFESLDEDEEGYEEKKTEFKIPTYPKAIQLFFKEKGITITEDEARALDYNEDYYEDFKDNEKYVLFDIQRDMTLFLDKMYKWGENNGKY